ncbi:MAG: T9SS type A sorting domain-containing protein [Ignavibacteriales bacterium]|nr:T9SS type A sorting domain-containing protein [Ignavibacteriales bacterium]
MVWVAFAAILSTCRLNAQQPAFPTAMGFGKFTVGGRGGKVIEVTNLNDAGTGSFRAAAASTGARTVVFRISGTILLNSDIKIASDSITIAGQTAPGDGICLRKYKLYVEANQVVIRYMRFRLGNEQGGSSESDAVGGTASRKNIIIDHCSASWSTDETLSFYDNSMMTVQWCLITESLYNSTHPKGAHGYGGIWGGQNVTFHHNLLAHHSSRNPRFCGSRYTRQPSLEVVDFRNNVVYNWGFNSVYGGEGGNQNMVNNYYKPGPATKSGALRYRILDLTSYFFDSSVRPDTVPAGNFYVSGNYVDGNTIATNDNWTYGVQTSVAVSQKNKSQAAAPFPVGSITTQTAQDAFDAVLTHAGASMPVRDTLDRRIVYETRMGLATRSGYSYPKKNLGDSTIISGIIDTQNDAGGWPVLNSLPAPLDSDHDGMPDTWEDAHGLTKSDPSDGRRIRPDGYSELEAYLNSLTYDQAAMSVQGPVSHPFCFSLEQNFPNPFNPVTRIRYTIPEIARVRLEVFDLLGKRLAGLVDEIKSPGSYAVDFDGGHLSSGIYLYRLSNGTRSISKKMILLR